MNAKEARRAKREKERFTLHEAGEGRGRGGIIEFRCIGAGNFQRSEIGYKIYRE